MAKKKKKEIVVDGIEFDSNEEVRFYYWLLDAVKAGLVTHWVYQPVTFTLCEPVPYTKTSYRFLKNPPFVKTGSRTVNAVQGYVYTPDFEIVFTDEMPRFYPDAFIYDITQPVLVDVKGGFSGGKNNTSGVTFGPKTAWLYNTQGIFVQKTVPDTLFKATWIPDVCRYTRVRKDPIEKYNTPKYKTYDQAVDFREKLQSLMIDEIITEVNR